MSDLSRFRYPHVGCGPCPCGCDQCSHICTNTFVPLTTLEVWCPTCRAVFLVYTEMSNHHLAAHQRPLARPVHSALPTSHNGVSPQGETL